MAARYKITISTDKTLGPTRATVVAYDDDGGHRVTTWECSPFDTLADVVALVAAHAGEPGALG